MNEKSSSALLSRIRSFVYAFRGLRTMLVSQHNARIHLACSLLVISLGLICEISSAEWCWVIISMIGVWTAEALNTAFEFLCDVASPDFHPLVEKSKDVAAGAVLLSAVGAFVVGAIIFVPKV